MSGHRQTGHFLVFWGVFQKSALGNVNVEVLWPNLVSNSNFILIKITMVWLLFETSRNLRNFASPDTAKWPFFSILGGISKKFFRQCKS